MNIEASSKQLTKLVLGLDAFYRQTRVDGSGKLDNEGLVPVHWSGEEAMFIDNWRDALRKLNAYLLQASLLPDPWARDWLCDYALSLITLVRWLSGEALSYEEIVAGTLGIDPYPPTEPAIRGLRMRRDAALNRAGYASFEAYTETNGVAKANLVNVGNDLLTKARKQASTRLPMLTLPPHPIEMMPVKGVPYTAYCDYPGKTIWINIDVPHTRSGLKQLVGHEAYPGHYLHMYHREKLVREGKMLPDAALVVTNTASSVLFEGIAERGLDLMAWRETPEDEIAWWQNRLEWLCSIEVAHALNTKRSSPKETAAFLRQTCDAHEAWIEGKLAFVTHHLRAPFVYCYWWGGTIVGHWWARISARKLGLAISYLYGKMHSPSTLNTHWHEGGNDENS